MKKLLVCVCAALAAASLSAIDFDNGLSIGGGVKTGLLIKNSDYAGKLEGAPHAQEYPLTLYFASQENETYNGEGWLDFNYSHGDWGLQLGAWAHGSLTKFEGALNLGDHYVWANFFDSRLLFKGGQGGGTPITTGGWINADWLGYTGLRLFWVDPLGFSVGINLPDPGGNGIEPVNYLTMIMLGAKYSYDNFWVSLMVDNNPIFDDSNAIYEGGLHGVRRLIGQAGNLAFGLGADNIFAGKGNVAFDGLAANLGVDPERGAGSVYYEIPTQEVTLALKANYPITEKIFVELKAKYLIKSGNNETDTGSTTWGKLEIEPYISYQLLNPLKFELTVNLASYINSYYLAVEELTPIGGHSIKGGQVSAYPWALDYLSGYELFIKPAVVFNYGGAAVMFGYNGAFSRDHVENTVYLDLRWSF
ncbi:MAG: hypothetical protein LBN21_07960 [Treponema sp.]|jgi:hypothetical protein|nr:hypothetical protein [Treponema sp.]